jgi:xylulokinase
VIALGIDIGTSSVKAALLDDEDRVIASASRPLSVSRPQPGFSEQDPQHWWQATCDAIDSLKSSHGPALTEVVAIGLSGQMHGAILLDADGRVLRPCILWNDGRSAPQCEALTAQWPALHAVTGNLAMPGFTAPKLMWVRQHEPEIFARVAKVLLPKAYVRWRLCGEAVEELSDASGTLWLDVGRREWSDAALHATGMRRDQMPRLVEGNAVAGLLASDLVRRWGFRRTPVLAGGAGDNAAGAIGVGAVRPGDAFVSLGTSGVLWATTGEFKPNPQRAVHAFCHAVPDTWHQMGVILAAASCLAWWARVNGQPEAALLDEAAAAPADTSVWFAPYLSGERTPHNDTAVRGGFLGLDAGTTRAEMTNALLDGVCFALRDAQQALAAAGTVLSEADLIGGGARSALWSQRLADVLNLTLHQVADSDLGCAVGAARLARMAAGEGMAAARKPLRLRSHAPHPERAARLAQRHAQWQRLYPMARDFARRQADQ